LTPVVSFSASFASSNPKLSMYSRSITLTACGVSTSDSGRFVAPLLVRFSRLPMISISSTGDAVGCARAEGVQPSTGPRAAVRANEDVTRRVGRRERRRIEGAPERVGVVSENHTQLRAVRNAHEANAVGSRGVQAEARAIAGRGRAAKSGNS